MIFIDINLNLGEETEFLILFVFTIFIIWLSLIYFTTKNYGYKKTVLYFLPMIIAALFIESAGVASGRYYYPGYLIYLSVLGGGVPPIILFAWNVNLFIFLNISRFIFSKLYDKYNLLTIFLISISAGVLSVFFDLLQDPIADHNNWWVWNIPSVETTISNIPLMNYVGWFVLIFYMSLSILLIERTNFSDNRKILLSLVSLPIIGGVILFTQMIISRILI